MPPKRSSVMSEVLVESKVSGRHCALMPFLRDKQTPEDAKEILALLQGYTVALAPLKRVLNNRGFPGSMTAIRNHRPNLCRECAELYKALTATKAPRTT